MRRIATIGSILLVAMSIARLGCDSTSAQTADDVAKRFVGMWSLVSITTNGQVNPDRGPHPSGFIVYDRSGNMAVQIMPDRNRPKYAGAQPTPDEAKAALIGYTAYFGAYTVDAQAGTVTHHRKGNINPGASIEVVGRYEFVGENRVILNPVENPATNSLGNASTSGANLTFGWIVSARHITAFGPSSHAEMRMGWCGANVCL